MGEDEAFLRTMDAAPGDAAPALVYADWLDEHGRPGGEYFRLLLALEAGDAVGRWATVRSRLRALRPGLGPEWVGRVSRSVLPRRRELWSALSDLFLDVDVVRDGTYPHVAARVQESGYGPAAVRGALWDEVFPAVEWNLRHPAGEWTPIPADWLEARILGLGPHPTPAGQPGTAEDIREEWGAVCHHLPPGFADELAGSGAKDSAAEPSAAPDRGGYSH